MLVFDTLNWAGSEMGFELLGEVSSTTLSCLKIKNRILESLRDLISNFAEILNFGLSDVFQLYFSDRYHSAYNLEVIATQNINFVLQGKQVFQPYSTSIYLQFAQDCYLFVKHFSSIKSEFSDIKLFHLELQSDLICNVCEAENFSSAQYRNGPWLIRVFQYYSCQTSQTWDY